MDVTTLTCAEWLSYPGRTPTERALAHHHEGHVSAARSPRAAPLTRVVDLRPYPGRDRLERAMHYVRAISPRSEHWSEQAVASLAEQILASSRVIE